VQSLIYLFFLRAKKKKGKKKEHSPLHSQEVSMIYFRFFDNKLDQKVLVAQLIGNCRYDTNNFSDPDVLFLGLTFSGNL